MKRCCEDCMWWNNSVSQRDNADTGQCVALPPKADDRSALAVWPFTEAMDWCASFLKGEC